MKIANRIAVITGASGGIGFAIARELARLESAAIALVDKSERCEQAAEEINTAAGSAIAVPFAGDVTDTGFRQLVFARMAERFGPVQICIPAAGITLDSLAVKVNRDTGQCELYGEEQFRKLLDINLLHPVYWAMETIAGIAQKRFGAGLRKWHPEEDIQGVVILIGSVSSRGNRGQVSYAAAKSGLVGAASTLNLEGLFHGVQTKIIHPGFVDTPMVDSIDSEYFEEHLKPHIGLGRKIQPDEIAKIICSMIENEVISGEVWADASMTPLA